MSSHGYQAPDLASILRTLSGQTSAQNAQPIASASNTGTQNSHHYQDPNRSFEAPYAFPQAQGPYPPQAQTPYQPIPVPRSPAPEARPVPKDAREGRPGLDPKTITSWPPALRYVTKLVAQNEEIAARVRKLIKSQHDHERHWAEGRERVIKDRQRREEGRNAINDVLRAVGGLIESAPSGEDAEDEATALARYDRKVHAACADMVKSVTNELAALGIPFFSIERSLISNNRGNGDAPSHSLNSIPAGAGTELDAKTLKDLEKRMLELLEDLCKD